MIVPVPVKTEVRAVIRRRVRLRGEFCVNAHGEVRDRVRVRLGLDLWLVGKIVVNFRLRLRNMVGFRAQL